MDKAEKSSRLLSQIIFTEDAFVCGPFRIQHDVLPWIYKSGKHKGKKKFLGWKLSYLLSFLLNFAYRKKAEQEHDGWFFCTVNTMTRNTGINRNSQTSMLNELEDSGFISLDKRSPKKRQPTVRYIRIEWDIIRVSITEGLIRMKLKSKDPEDV